MSSWVSKADRGRQLTGIDVPLDGLGMGSRKSGGDLSINGDGGAARNGKQSSASVI